MDGKPRTIYFLHFCFHFFLLIYIAYGGTYRGDHDVSTGDIKSCSVLYSEPNSQGQSFRLKDHDQSADLMEDQRASTNHGWNVTTSSILVETGCKLTICNDTYFDGHCDTITSGTYSKDQIPYSVASVSCNCLKQCKCSDVHVKMPYCGRAYLKGGCSTCHAHYTDLSTNWTISKYFPEDFAKKVEAFRLRKGCTMTIYSEEDFEGEEMFIDQEVFENFSGEIGSYQCVCNDAVYAPRVKPSRPLSYPQWLNISSDANQVFSMMDKDGNINHPGVNAARRSYKNGRSSKNAYILVLGSTGSGKSSAINLLFDNPNITKVGDRESTTSAIHEFRIPVPIDELGIANSELRVIDTPGLGDTRGLESDAKFLATLDNYLSTHEELKDRIPNVVLIFHKFNDNRFDGPGANFVKMIRGFDSFRKRITDDKFSNVVFVFSHVMSIPKQERRRPDARIRNFQEVIQDYSLLPKPTHVVLAENKARECDLPMVNGYFKLPSNDYYPRNLFEKLDLITEKCGDPIGQGVFRTAFRDSDGVKINRIDYFLLSSSTSQVQQYLGVLTNANLNVENTEISQHLQQVWDLKMDADLKKRYPHSLAYLQKALNLRNINSLQNVPRLTPQILELVTALKHDLATRTLLEKALNIQPPEFPHNTIAGNGYHVFRDMALSMSPFQLGELQHSDIGFRIPSSLTCNLEPGTKEHFQVFQDKASYLQHRLQSLGINGNIPVEKFTNAIQPGCNIQTLSFRPNGCTVSAAKDFRLFELVLNDKPKITPEFAREVRNLNPVNTSDPESVTAWMEFFNKYGTHVVKSVYGGGSIQVRLESDKPFDPQFADAMFQLVKFAEDLTYDLEYTGNNGRNKQTKNLTALQSTSQSTTFLGGDPDFHTTNLGKMPVTEASKLLDNWKKSLRLSPTMLATEMKLVPISRFVKELGQNYTEEIDRATQLLFNSDLVYKPPPKKKEVGPGYARDETPMYQEMMRMMKEESDRFQQLSLELKKVEQENERKRLELEKQRIEWQKEQAQREAQYRKEQEENKRNADQEKMKWEEKREQAKREHELEVLKLNNALEAQKAQAKLDSDKMALERHEAQRQKEKEESDKRMELLLAEIRAQKDRVAAKEEQWQREQREWERRREEETRKHEREMRERDQRREEEMRRIQQEADAQHRRDKEDSDRRFRELIESNNKKDENSGGCLKAGTDILMADGSEKKVDNLKVGDLVLDKDLRPSRVLGVAREFLMNQSFYGFAETGPFFFTKNHIFVGPSAGKGFEENGMQLYAASTSALYQDNPLMSYFNVQEMKRNAELVHLEGSRDNTLSLKSANIWGVYQDSGHLPEDTLMYDIQVDSPSGTYIANGYVCRHEVPPLYIWPNTMSILLPLLKTPVFQEKLPRLPYTVETVSRLRLMVDEVTQVVTDFLHSRAYSRNRSASSENVRKALMTFEGEDMEESISSLFHSSPASTTALRLYSRLGPLIAQHLDGAEESIMDEIAVATLQHELFELIRHELEIRVSHLM